ncbi:MAG: glutathione S-transferase family protein [Symploca sp. SIO1B1]|nr:glutathione S-transferase family protein [Symploca sp. SIO1B1]
MLKLYGGKLTRAFIVEWYLEELAVPYEFFELDMQTGVHLQPEFLSINPMGKLPAIEDGTFKLWESGAILLYLAEKYHQLPESLEQRAEINQWIFFANATLIQGIFVVTNLDREYPRLFQPLNDICQRQPFLLGNEFSVVDVAVGAVLAYIPILLQLDLSFYPEEIVNSIKPLSKIDFNSYPGVKSYIEALTARPAFRKTIGARVY